jgi:hypothetical protein
MCATDGRSMPPLTSMTRAKNMVHRKTVLLEIGAAIIRAKACRHHKRIVAASEPSTNHALHGVKRFQFQQTFHRVRAFSMFDGACQVMISMWGPCFALAAADLLSLPIVLGALPWQLQQEARSSANENEA